MPTIISSVKALIEQSGKYIFLKEEFQNCQLWDLPGGKIEYGESPQQALLREIKEELSIDVAIVRSVGVWHFFTVRNNDQIICHTFLCKPTSKQFSIDITKNPADEHICEFHWLTLDEALENQKMNLTDSLIGLLKTLRDGD